MIHGQDLICISSIDWDFNWQGHQEIMATFARQGNRVLFIENTGVRSPGPRDLPRLVRRVANWWKSTKGFRSIEERLWVFSPVILPYPYSPITRWINRRLLLSAIRRWMRATGFHDPIIWTFLPTGTALDIIKGLDHKLAVYYCIADFEELASSRHKVRRTEQAVIRACDLIFAQGTVLAAKCRRWNSNVFIFPFGVNLETFGAKGRDTSAAELQGVSRPIIGYLGGLHRHVDYSLIRTMAEAHPDWSLVLVGPEQADVSMLDGATNIHRLGKKPFGDVPAYVQAFDVAIIPYVESEYTKTVYPTKLNEYHALGKPVVSTPLPEVVAFNQRHGGLVRVAGSPEAFIRAVEAALAQPSDGLTQRRMAVAREHGWAARIAQMGALLVTEMQRKAAMVPGDWQGRLAAGYRQVKRRTLGTAAIVACGYVLLFYTPMIWWLAEPLRIEQSPQPSDAIVVFAGGVGESGQPGQGYEERVAWAAELYANGWAPRMIFSSGFSYRFEETQIMKALAVSLGVPPETIILEDRARNTYENVVYTNEILELGRWTSVLLVSSPYHMRRAGLVWRSVAPRRMVTYAPIPRSAFYNRRSGGLFAPQIRWAQLRGIMHEYLGLLYYWWKGYLK